MPLMPKAKPGQRIPLEIHEPVVLVQRLPDGKLETMLFQSEGVVNTPAGIGLIACDIVRHAAKAYGVDEEDIFRWIDKERDNPTTTVTRTGPN